MTEIVSQTEAGSGGRGTRGGMLVVGGVLALSTLFALVLYVQYSQLLRYVKDTLQDPENPPVWESEALAPHECVDVALAWAQDCSGIKSLCDQYVTRVMEDCLTSQDRESYCVALGEIGESTHFGYDDCASRGVQRNVDAEACSFAYRAIADYCGYVQRAHDAEAGAETEVE